MLRGESMEEQKGARPAGRLLHSLQFPEDLARGNVFVSMHGQERVWIENFRGISCYSSEEIRLTARGRCVCITGRNLEIVSYTKEEIEIAGHICALSFPEASP